MEKHHVSGVHACGKMVACVLRIPLAHARDNMVDRYTLKRYMKQRFENACMYDVT